MRKNQVSRTSWLALLCAAPLLAGCAGVGGDMFQTDLLSKDADWFSKPGRVFIKNVSIETPPLTPDKAVTQADLVGADGSCPGMAPTPNALANGAAAAPSYSGVIALGHNECDVVRGVGAPDNVALSNNGRGDRVAVLTYSRGDRAGLYTFTAGRLTMVERGPEAAPVPRSARPKAAKKRAAT